MTVVAVCRYRLDQDMVQVVPRCCPLCPLQKLSVRSPPSFPVKPVSDVAYSQDERYKGTWVAEVEMVRPVHDAVTGYLQLRKRVCGCVRSKGGWHGTPR